MAICFIALGSNLGRREANLKKAVELLSSRVKIFKKSSIYETEPTGVFEGRGAKGKKLQWFLNMAIKGETKLSPRALLKFTQMIEKKLGRLQRPRPIKKTRYTSRSIDLDILFYDDLVVKTSILTIPHLEIENRLFVLKPMAEIAPRMRHPLLKKNMRELCKNADLL